MNLAQRSYFPPFPFLHFHSTELLPLSQRRARIPMWADGDSVLSKNHSFCQLFASNFCSKKPCNNKEGKQQSFLAILTSIGQVLQHESPWQACWQAGRSGWSDLTCRQPAGNNEGHCAIHTYMLYIFPRLSDTLLREISRDGDRDRASGPVTVHG